MVRVMVAEDETALRDQLVRELKHLWPEAAIVAAVGDGDAALRAFEDESPEVAFLDVKMPGLSGLEVANALAGQCHLVFVTAHDDAAVKAFEAGAIDYLLKPVSRERLALTIERVKARLGNQPSVNELLPKLAAAAERPREPLRWLQASVGRAIEFADVSQVLFFRAEDKYTTVALEGRELLIRTSLKELLAQLDPALFWQVHRSTIVNVAFISRAIHRDDELVLELKGRGEQIAVSRAFRKRFKQL